MTLLHGARPAIRGRTCRPQTMSFPAEAALARLGCRYRWNVSESNRARQVRIRFGGCFVKGTGDLAAAQRCDVGFRLRLSRCTERASSSFGARIAGSNI
jgi:hypothetical protein